MSYYPIRIVKDPTLIINSNEIIKGNLEANEIDLIAGANIDVSSLSIDNTEIIDSSRNIKNINLMSSLTLESNTLNYFDSITLEDVVGNSLAVLGKHGTGQNAKLELYDTTDGEPSRKVFISSNPNTNGYINLPFAFGTSGVMQATSQVQIDSTTKGFLPPRMTQTQKLAISNPVEGLEVYDTTSKCKSYFNGTNWFVPSYVSFRNTQLDLTASSILWDIVNISADARISFNNVTGIFTVSEPGIYEVQATGNFNITASGNVERNIVLDFRESAGTVLASSNACITVFTDAGTTYTTNSINYLLTVTTNLTYSFNFSSQSGNNIILSTGSHGFIKRIL